ncbi:MAG TPA: succinate dehydrogenase cytochrome b subunit [Thermoanaerobaculaceae bacterium]|nr:succinate dehydrogenase cytochrome b subunit [Thermoanaerobaculaceae bacterium]
MQALARYYGSTLGKKFVMAVTGGILFAFVLLHMIGNLQVFLGREQLNSYARLLRVEPLLLWTARVVLLACVSVHILAAVQLTLHDWSMRPVGYARRRYRSATYAARTMVWSGPIIAAFVIYHLLHFTFGTLHPSFVPDDVYHNVVAGFSVWYVSAFYVLAQLLLGLHLYHGMWSLFQTLGVSHASHDAMRRTFATAVAVLIVAGNCSIPIAVLAGLVR